MSYTVKVIKDTREKSLSNLVLGGDDPIVFDRVEEDAEYISFIFKANLFWSEGYWDKKENYAGIQCALKNATIEVTFDKSKLNEYINLPFILSYNSDYELDINYDCLDVDEYEGISSEAAKEWAANITIWEEEDAFFNSNNIEIIISSKG